MESKPIYRHTNLLFAAKDAGHLAFSGETLIGQFKAFASSKVKKRADLRHP